MMCYYKVVEYKELIKSVKAFINIKNEFLSGKIGQQYLFVCEDELTSELLLKNIANLLICENKNFCGTCASCQKANASSHPDILVYPKSKSFVVSDASSIYDSVQVKPMIADYKIYIINNIDNSTEQAQNKMLKILEEPPENVIFLMSAKNENKVLRTIISRTQKIHVDKIDKNLLKNIINTSDDIAQIAISNGGGYLGKTLYIAGNDEFLNIYNNMVNLLLNLKNSTQIPLFSKFFYENKLIFENSLIILNDFFRDLIMLKLNSKNLIKNTNLLNEYTEIEKEYSENALIEILKRLNNFKRKLDSNVNLTTLADGMLLEILEVKYLCK